LELTVFRDKHILVRNLRFGGGCLRDIEPILAIKLSETRQEVTLEKAFGSPAHETRSDIDITYAKMPLFEQSAVLGPKIDPRLFPHALGERSLRHSTPRLSDRSISSSRSLQCYSSIVLIPYRRHPKLYAHARPCSRPAQSLHLSKSDVSVLYRKWESSIRPRQDEIVMRIRPKTTATEGDCPTPYTVLGVKLIDDGKLYVIEIKQSEPATRGAQIKGRPGCVSDGLPFVAWELPSSVQPGGLPSLWGWGCSSYDELRELDEQAPMEFEYLKAHPKTKCWYGGFWTSS